jgi:hypothetical protein
MKTPARKLEQEGFDIDYTAEMNQFLERKECLRTNMRKAYSLIFQNYCSKSMQ